jgi:hypothetical protein
MWRRCRRPRRRRRRKVTGTTSVSDRLSRRAPPPAGRGPARAGRGSSNATTNRAMFARGIPVRTVIHQLSSAPHRVAGRWTCRSDGALRRTVPSSTAGRGGGRGTPGHRLHHRASGDSERRTSPLGGARSGWCMAAEAACSSTHGQRKWIMRSKDLEGEQKAHGRVGPRAPATARVGTDPSTEQSLEVDDRGGKRIDRGMRQRESGRSEEHGERTAGRKQAAVTRYG